MKTPPVPHAKHDGLRLRAEQCREAGGRPNSGPVDPMDAQRLLQELEIHQIELEMQNLELQQARNQAEVHLETALKQLKISLEKSEGQRKQLRTLTHTLLQAQEEERKRISRELHDRIVQALVAIQYEFELLALESKGRMPGLQEQITRTQNILEGSIDLVHGFAFDLRPSALDNLGLGPTLETFADRFQNASGLSVTLDLCEELGRIGSMERTMLYRVVQEAFSNVSRHARAENVSLRIVEKNNGIRMEITDDGVGMDPESIKSTVGEARLGMIGMKERVEMLGGAFRVLSRQGKYTTIRVDLPIGKEIHSRSSA